MRSLHLALAWLVVLSAHYAVFADEPTSREIDNLETFSRLYGYVRFFHPSDEASATDWSRLALHGANTVRDAPDSAELAVRLRGLFHPIAPTVEVFAVDGEPDPRPEAAPGDTSGLKLVAWQHRGVGLRPESRYVSARTNRAHEKSAAGHGFGTISQSVDASPYRGQAIKLRAAVRTAVEGPGNRGQLWLRVDRPQRQTGFFDNMGDRPITASDWATYGIAGTVDDDATRIVFGGFLAGRGRVWIDDVELWARREGEEWTPVEVANGDFEQSTEEVIGWFTRSPGYSYAIDTAVAMRGKHSLRIDDVTELEEGALFDAVPRAGETVTKEIGSGLRARIPIALYSDDEGTLGGDPDHRSVEGLEAALATIDLASTDATSRDLRDACVVIAWNVFQHFYPYFDVVESDWDATLTAALLDVADDETAGDLADSLRRMTVALRDGHVRVAEPQQTVRAFPPFAAEWVEGGPIVIETYEDETVHVGDLLLSVDGVPIDEYIATAESLISGSPQWKRHRAVREIGAGAMGTTVEFRIDRAGREVVLKLERDRDRPVPPRDRPAIEQLPDGVFYVDLTRAELGQIRERIADLATAPGVVFDMRGYPNGNHAVIQHLIDEPVRSAIWNVPQTIYPDRQQVAWDRSGRWTLLPTEPRIRGPVAFMTNAGAISYAESVMGIVEHYRIGEIVGQPTAGTNGNVNMIPLPGGFSVSWTGMKVLKHDESQHHLIGIRPTIPVGRTVAGVRAGRDEYLDAALSALREGAEE